MMRIRLLPFCISLVLCLINIKAFASTESPHSKALSPYIFTESGEQLVDELPLKSTNVKVNINGAIAEVTVKQQYINKSNRIISGRYIFAAPKEASLHGMRMKSKEDNIAAKVKERDSAMTDFNRLKEQGKSVSLLNQHSPNLFSMNLANIMPGDTVNIEFTYTELLIPTDMTYEFVYPIFSEQSEGKFNIEVTISSDIPLQDVVCMTHDTDIILETESRTKIMLKDSDKKGDNRDYILNYRLAAKKLPSGLILSKGEGENFLLLNKYVSASVLTDISVKFTDLETYDVEPSPIPDRLVRRPVIVLGKWRGKANGLIEMKGRTGRRNYSKTFRFVKNRNINTNGALKHLWAGKKISHLSAPDTGMDNQEIKSEIINLGLKYNQLTKHTSFIAVSDTDRKAEVQEVQEITAKLFKQPSPLAKEPVKLAAIKSVNVPEPGLFLSGIFITTMVISGHIRRKLKSMNRNQKRGYRKQKSGTGNQSFKS